MSVPVTYETADCLLRERLGESAYAHSVRTAETAYALATVYGVDAELARIAGLLHDWDRECEHAALVESARERGLAVSDTDVASPYLLHARTGAAGLREALPGLDSAVLSAVEKHTVGAVEMSELDKVVYLADMVEPGRTWDGVEGLREAAGNISLDELFALGYQRSLAHLLHERKRIHPDTVAVYNAHVARERR